MNKKINRSLLTASLLVTVINASAYASDIKHRNKIETIDVFSETDCIAPPYGTEHLKKDSRADHLYLALTVTLNIISWPVFYFHTTF